MLTLLQQHESTPNVCADQTTRPSSRLTKLCRLLATSCRARPNTQKPILDSEGAESIRERPVGEDCQDKVRLLLLQHSSLRDTVLIWQCSGDIILYDNHVVVFKTEGDTMLFVVGSADENEILLFNAVLALRDCLNILLKTSVDRRTIIENYDLVCLAIDELCDDGMNIFGRDLCREVIRLTYLSRCSPRDRPNHNRQPSQQTSATRREHEGHRPV
jgi:hypothetical protein